MPLASTSESDLESAADDSHYTSFPSSVFVPIDHSTEDGDFDPIPWSEKAVSRDDDFLVDYINETIDATLPW